MLSENTPVITNAKDRRYGEFVVGKAYQIDLLETFLLSLNKRLSMFNARAKVFSLSSKKPTVRKLWDDHKDRIKSAGAISPLLCNEAVIFCSPADRFMGNAHGLVFASKPLHDFCESLLALEKGSYKIVSQLILRNVLKFPKSDMDMIGKMHLHVLDATSLAFAKSTEQLLDKIKQVVTSDHEGRHDFIFSGASSQFWACANRQIKTVPASYIAELLQSNRSLV